MEKIVVNFIVVVDAVKLCCQLLSTIYETFILPFKLNTTHIELVKCNCVWIEELNIFVKYGFLSDKMFVLLDEMCKIYKLCLKNEALVVTI